MVDKLPPQNIDVEESILGGILLDPKAMSEIAELISPEAFYVQVNRDIYQAALILYRAGKPTDLMSVTNWLQDQGLLEKVGGTNKLAELVSRTVSAVNIDRYGELMMDKYLRRKLIYVGNEIVDLGYDTTQELDSVFDRAEQSLFKVSNQKLVSSTERNSEIAFAVFDDLDQESPIYPTGLYDLDELMVGFEPGTLTLVAGRPSMGKSYIAVFLSVLMMLKHKLPVIFFSLEMTLKQLEYRLWSLISVLECYKNFEFLPLPSDRIRKHRAGKKPLSKSELYSIAKIIGHVACELPLYMNDNRGITVAGIASECRRLAIEHGRLGLVVVDYLQMMASDSGGNRSYELGDVARGLYKLAADVNVPVLALSQINRAVEGRQDKRPTMADLSQSGVLEMVADNVILAYRDEYYNPNTADQKVLELIMAKARHGTTGKAKFFFDPSYGLIKNMA